MKDYCPYHYKGKNLLITQYLLLGMPECTPENYNLFDTNIPAYAVKSMQEIEQDGYKNFSIFNDRDNELFNIFRYLKEPLNKRILLYSEVYSERKARIILDVMCSAIAKLWVNGECMSIHRKGNQRFLFDIRLNKGKNVILVEKYSAIDKNRLIILLRNYNFEMSQDEKAASHLWDKSEINSPILVCDNEYQPTVEKFRFMYMMYSGGKYKAEYKIAVRDSQLGIIEEIDGHRGEILEIDLRKYRELDSEIFRHIRIKCIFFDKQGEEFITRFNILINNLEQKREEIKRKALDYAGKMGQGGANWFYGRLRVGNILNIDHDTGGGLYWHLTNIRKIILRIEGGNFSLECYHKAGHSEVFFHSKLDDSYMKILMRTPLDYDRNRRYPAFIFISTGAYNNYSKTFPCSKISEPVLCFDVTGRGFTGGSYIGEASIFEIIGWIKSNFNIDEDRIYLAGLSNGGFATWAIAQNYPDIAAAIYPLIGYPHIKNIENASNIPAYQIVSPQDHVMVGRENEVKTLLYKFGNYFQYDYQQMIHYHFSEYILHPTILNKMLKAKRNLYPKKVVFRTERHRNLKSFWLCLHGIKRGRKYAKISAEILGNDRIKIIVCHAVGFSVTLPPEIDRGKFRLIINNKIFEYENITQNHLHFTYKNGYEAALDVPRADCRKGTGLLDIYLGSMRIVLPDNAEKVVEKIAKNFSNPHSNGAFPILYVNYPIYHEPDLPHHLFEHNLLIIDIKAGEFREKYTRDLQVSYDSKGYEYQGEYFETEYVIMQVLPNPYDFERSILLVSSNNESLLKKHILLRKVVIPTYYNGIHDYWNNAVLILDRDGYKRAYEVGDALEKI